MIKYRSRTASTLKENKMPIKVVYEAEVKMSKLTDILEAVRTEYMDVEQAEAEIKALMDEEELFQIIQKDKVFKGNTIDVADRLLAKAIKQWWASSL